MLARVRQHVKERGVAIAASLAIHALLLVLALLIAAPASRHHVKRGEALFVELPQSPEPPPAGNPGARTPGPPLASRNARVKTPPAKPAPPTAKPAAPATKPPPPVAKPEPPAARPAPPDVAKPPAPPVVAKAPVPEAPKPAPPTPAPPIPEGPGPEARAPEPPPRPSPAPDGASAAKTAPSEGQPSSGGQQVASVPPARESAPLDIRSLGRGGGAGSAHGGGRGGIEGEPIPLDSKDPKYSDYLDHVRRKIKANWGYPCVKNGDTRACEYKTATLIVEFGIAKDGRVPFVNVVRSSGWSIYDDYAVNAIKFASPFLPIPDALSKKGIPVLATFNYMVDTSLTNLLR